MTFNLTPTIEIDSIEELDAAITELDGETDTEWLTLLRERAEAHLESQNREAV